MEPHLRVGIDVGYKTHRVAIADPDGNILEEFNIPHTVVGFERFFARVEHHRSKDELPVAVAMEALKRGQPCKLTLKPTNYCYPLAGCAGCTRSLEFSNPKTKPDASGPRASASKAQCP